MGKLSSLRKRRNKKEYRARLKLEIEAREGAIAGLKVKLRKSIAEMKLAKR